MTDRESDEERDERRERIIAALIKVVGVAVAIGVAIGIGTWVMVKALGLDDATTSVVGPAPVTPIKPLPTKALPQSTGTPAPTDEPTDEPSDELTDYPTAIVTPSPGNGDIFLNAAPVFVKPMERVNLTGQWPGHDNVSLLVQRFENGEWVDFGVQVNVQIGTFETYVMSSREGENKFRVFDPETNTFSNDVAVTIEG